MDGWTLFYDLSKDEFVATKGRKTRRAKHVSWLRNEMEKADAAVKRAAVRVEPCEFIYWDDEKQSEQRVQMTAYSDKGLGIRPAAGGEVVNLPLAGWRGRWGKGKPAVAVIKDGTNTKRLHAAVEGLRRAEEELRQARAACVVDVEVNTITGNKSEPYSEEEDRLRKAINVLNGKVST